MPSRFLYRSRPTNLGRIVSMTFMKRALVAFGAIVALAQGAAAFPDRPVHVIVPWAAGGGMDTVVRIFAAGFEKELGVPVNVVNRTGGGGITGHYAISTATPDGYTIGAASPEISFYKALGLGDITPASFDLFSRISLIPAGVTVRADAPYKDLKEFLAAVKASPKGALSASGTGTGGSWHIAAGGLLKAAGIEPDRLKWVPSQGGAPALQDVAAGGITAFTGSPVEAKALLDAGRVRTLGLMTAERPPTFPDLPTTKEAGIDWTFQNWFALVAPKGVPPDRREKLFEAARKTMARPEVQEGMKQRGITPVWDKPGEFDAYVSTFVARGTEVLKDLGLAK
jgi:tripartite-type tricarboxylate transporter receptor subunit TctC